MVIFDPEDKECIQNVKTTGGLSFCPSSGSADNTKNDFFCHRRFSSSATLFESYCKATQITHNDHNKQIIPRYFFSYNKLVFENDITIEEMCQTQLNRIRRLHIK